MDFYLIFFLVLSASRRFDNDLRSLAVQVSNRIEKSTALTTISSRHRLSPLLCPRFDPLVRRAHDPLRKSFQRLRRGKYHLVEG